MKLSGFGLFVENMAVMIRFYRDVLGFDIKEGEDSNLPLGAAHLLCG